MENKPALINTHRTCTSNHHEQHHLDHVDPMNRDKKNQHHAKNTITVNRSTCLRGTATSLAPAQPRYMSRLDTSSACTLVTMRNTHCNPWDVLEETFLPHPTRNARTCCFETYAAPYYAHRDAWSMLIKFRWPCVAYNPVHQSSASISTMFVVLMWEHHGMFRQETAMELSDACAPHYSTSYSTRYPSTTWMCTTIVTITSSSCTGNVRTHNNISSSTKDIFIIKSVSNFICDNLESLSLNPLIMCQVFFLFFPVARQWFSTLSSYRWDLGVYPRTLRV